MGICCLIARLHGQRGGITVSLKAENFKRDGAGRATKKSRIVFERDALCLHESAARGRLARRSQLRLRSWTLDSNQRASFCSVFALGTAATRSSTPANNETLSIRQM